MVIYICRREMAVLKVSFLHVTFRGHKAKVKSLGYLDSTYVFPYSNTLFHDCRTQEVRVPIRRFSW